MFDIGKEKIDVKCDCGRKHHATLKDVTNRKKINCICGSTIQLSDSGGSVKKSVTDINKSISDLEKALKKLR